MPSLRGDKPILKRVEMMKRDKREKQGKGYYFCPRCGSKYANSKWRQKDPARLTCQNGHKKTNMIWFISMAELMLKNYPLGRWR